MSPLTTFLLQNETGLNRIRAFHKSIPHTIEPANLEEHMAMPSIRANTRIWQTDEQVIAFAYVDGYNNLYFEIDPQHRSQELELAVVDWGAACIQERNAGTGASATLDYSCEASDVEMLAFLERHGFQREAIRSLKYERPLSEPVELVPLPPGFSIRAANGESEVDALVALHRAAFGTDHMTVEERLAIMSAPGYLPELDLVAVAPDGSLAAFCICTPDADHPSIGHTDPIGTHPQYQHMGLGKAIVSAGLKSLQERGVKIAKTGTSSQNVRMQKLAERMGFVLVSENLWFSKKV